MPIGPKIRVAVTITAPNQEMHDKVTAEVRQALTAAGYPWKDDGPPPPQRPALRVIRGGGEQQ